MGKLFRLKFLLLVLLSVNVSARVVTSQEYNGYIYNRGYVCDFTVDGISYTIQDKGVFVSAEKYLCDLETEASISAPSEIILNSSYHGNIKIPEAVIFNGIVYEVVGIDVAAFKDCKDLLGVSFPDNLLFIGESSFRNCINLESVFFPNGYMNEIGKYAFAGCTGLNYINIPYKFSCYFDPTVFDGCIIDSVYWNSFNISPTLLFGNQGNCIMKHVYVDAARDYIGTCAFSDCNFYSVTISPQIKYIEQYAFRYCNNLKKIVWEGSTEIHNGAFMDCDNIDTIVIQSSRAPSAIDMSYGQPILDYFSPQVYENATLIIPTGSMDEYMLSLLWSRFKSVKEADIKDHEKELADDSGDDQEDDPIVYRKGYVFDFKVDGIYYTIQDGGVYVSAERLMYDPIGANKPWEVVENSAYYGAVTIPETVKYGDTIYNVIGIDKAAFKGCSYLEQIEIPATVTHIGTAAFYGCSGLREVKLPPLLSVVESSVFRECTGLESITFPENLRIVGVDAFRDCSGLKALILPDSLQRIESCAFDGCSNVKVLSMPENVTSLDGTAFQGLSSLESIYWYSPYVTSYPFTLYKWSLKNVFLGDEIKEIVENAFRGCANLTSITIPEKVEKLGPFSFAGCWALKKIVIEGCPIISEHSFLDCGSVDTVVLKSHIPPTAINYMKTSYGVDDGFADEFFSEKIFDKAVLCIPVGSMDEYMSSPLWSRFSLVEEIDFDEQESDLGNDSIFYYVHEDGDTIYYVVHEDGIHVVSKSLIIIGSGKTHGFDDPLTPRDPMAGGLQPRFGTRSGSGETIDTLDFKTYSGSVVIPESVPYKESVFTVTCIDKYAFAGGRELVSVSLPESVKILGYGCFAGCSGLTEIIIPESVTVIDEYAFAYCTGLKRVVIEGNPEIAETAFIGCETDLEFVMTKVESKEAKDLDLQSNGAVHYSINGRIIPADAPGLHVIKYKNGIVGKAWVR